MFSDLVNINVGRIRPIAVVFRLFIPRVLRDGRADVVRMWKPGAQVSNEIRRRLIDELAGHVFQRLLEG